MDAMPEVTASGTCVVVVIAGLCAWTTGVMSNSGQTAKTAAMSRRGERVCDAGCKMLTPRQKSARKPRTEFRTEVSTTKARTTGEQRKSSERSGLIRTVRSYIERSLGRSMIVVFWENHFMQETAHRRDNFATVKERRFRAASASRK